MAVATHTQSHSSGVKGMGIELAVLRRVLLSGAAYGVPRLIATIAIISSYGHAKV